MFRNPIGASVLCDSWAAQFCGCNTDVPAEARGQLSWALCVFGAGQHCQRCPVQKLWPAINIDGTCEQAKMPVIMLQNCLLMV